MGDRPVSSVLCGEVKLFILCEEMAPTALPLAILLLTIGLSSLFTTFVANLCDMPSVTLSFWLVVCAGFLCASSSSFNPDVSSFLTPGMLRPGSVSR